MESDDNFWKISKKQYGTPRYFQALTKYNQERVPDPNKMRTGTQILTPPAAVLEQKYPDLIEKTAPTATPTPKSIDQTSQRPSFEKPMSVDENDNSDPRSDATAGVSGYFYSRTGEPLYRIGPDDTLGGIAQKHLGRTSRWRELYELNQNVLKSPDNLTVGAVIRLPSDASRVGLAPDVERRR